MVASSAGKWAAALLSLCALLALWWWWLAFRDAQPIAEFAQNFIESNRRMDDRASAVAYDSEMKILAVGRDSGRLELWDTRKTDSRIARDAHTVRIDHIAIGAEDGVVLTSSAGTTVMGLDPHGMPKVWDARSGELLLALSGEWHGGPLAASPVPGFYLLASADELRVYDHARRAVVGKALQLRGQVTALSSDRTSGLVAVGSSSGELVLLELDVKGEIPRLEVINRTSIYNLETRTDVLAVMLRGTASG